MHATGVVSNFQVLRGVDSFTLWLTIILLFHNSHPVKAQLSKAPLTWPTSWVNAVVSTRVLCECLWLHASQYVKEAINQKASSNFARVCSQGSHCLGKLVIILWQDQKTCRDFCLSCVSTTPLGDTLKVWVRFVFLWAWLVHGHERSR